MLYEKKKLWVSLQNCPSLMIWKRYIKELKEDKLINSYGYNRKYNIKCFISNVKRFII
jgi:hypothetical protein